MWEFEYFDTETGKRDFIYGRSWEQALKKFNMDNSNKRYRQLFVEFVD